MSAVVIPAEVGGITKKRSIHWAWYVLSGSFLSTLVSYDIRLGYEVIPQGMIKSLEVSSIKGDLTYSTIFLVYITIFTIFAPTSGT